MVLLTWQQEQKYQAPYNSTAQKYSNSANSSLFVNCVQTLELEVGNCASNEEVALEHSPEYACIPGHRLFSRVYCQERSLNGESSFSQF